MNLFKSMSVPTLFALGLLLSQPGSTETVEPKTIVITAKRFEFSPKEIRIKKGETVCLVLKSEDVTHGFFSPKLNIDTDIPPGVETRVVITPREEGRFPVICNHFCGSGHGNMNMLLIVE